MKKMHHLLTDLLFDLLAGTLYAAGLSFFAKPANFVPGGISGLALIVNHLWHFPVGLTTLILNIPLVVLSYQFVGRIFLLKTLRSMVFCTVFLDIIFPFFPVYHGAPMLAAIFSGICIGGALGLLYRRGSSSGGADLLTMSIKVLRPHLSIGTVTLLIDTVVILLGLPVFASIDAVLYGLIATFTASFIIDRTLSGVTTGKLLLIITDKGRQIAASIGTSCGRSATICHATGAYSGVSRQIIFCACTRAEACKIRMLAYHIDQGCFIMIANTSEVFGEGFISHRKQTGLP